MGDYFDDDEAIEVLVEWMRSQETFTDEAIDAQERFLTRGRQLLHRDPHLAERDGEMNQIRGPLLLGEAAAGCGTVSPTDLSDPECDETLPTELEEDAGIEDLLRNAIRVRSERGANGPQKVRAPEIPLRSSAERSLAEPQGRCSKRSGLKGVVPRLEQVGKCSKLNQVASASSFFVAEK